MKIFNIVGARPNFMKIAPLLRAAQKYPRLKMRLIHTGQHYDYNMSKTFFNDLSLPKPDIYLGAGSGAHAEQTGRIMIALEKAALKEKPDLIIVVGDVNSTLAGALVAAKLHIPLAHIEAGLRSFDRAMPEEINRVVTDSLSDLLFIPDPYARDNLIKEGIPRSRIFSVGNIMIDTLHYYLPKAKKSDILTRKDGIGKLGLSSKQYAVLTMHRPANVDNRKTFSRLIKALTLLARDIPIVFPAHPRTLKQIRLFGFNKYFSPASNILLTKALGYLDAINLYLNAKFALTDSGGVQEETTALGIPCLTLRNTTEWKTTLTTGTNILVGTAPDKILKEGRKIILGKERKGRLPKNWDGKSARRIIRVILTTLRKDI